MLSLCAMRCQRSFERLKQAFCRASIVLAYADVTKPFELHTDGSSSSVAWILTQRTEDGKEVVCAYSWRSLRPNEREWSTTEIELSAIIEGITENRVFFANKPFTVYIDHLALTQA